jgi:hypothetical protein
MRLWEDIMVERAAEDRESNRDLWENIALVIGDRIEKEVVKRLGRGVQYVVAISIGRGSETLDLGIDLQLFSTHISREKLLEAADEVIEAGFREAENYIEKSGRRDQRAIKGEKGSDIIAPLS